MRDTYKTITNETLKFTDGTIWKSVIVLVDEKGNASLDAKERIFAATATILGDTETFGAISRRHREELGIDELKYRTAPKETKKEVLSEIEEIDYRVVGVYIDKTAEDNPTWWFRHKTHRGKHQIQIVEELAGDLFKEDIDNLIIAIDEHTAYKTGKAKSIIIDFATGANKTLLYVEQESSKDGRHKDLLQTNDILIGDIGRSLRDDRPLDARVKMRRLTKDNEK